MAEGVAGFDVWLVGVNLRDDDAAKAMAEAFAIEKQTAYALLARMPVAVKRGVPNAAATEYAWKLERAGARVEIRPALGPVAELSLDPAQVTQGQWGPAAAEDAHASADGPRGSAVPTAAGGSSTVVANPFHVVSTGRRASTHVGVPSPDAPAVAAPSRAAPPQAVAQTFKPVAAPTPTEPSEPVESVIKPIGAAAAAIAILVLRAVFGGSPFRGTASAIGLFLDAYLAGTILFAGVRLFEIQRAKKIEGALRKGAQVALYLVMLGTLFFLNLALQTATDVAGREPRGADGDPEMSPLGEPATPAALGILVARAVAENDEEAYEALSVTNAEVVAVEEGHPTEGTRIEMETLNYLKHEDRLNVNIEFRNVVASDIFIDTDVDALRPIVQPDGNGGGKLVLMRVPLHQRGIAIRAVPWRDGFRARSIDVSN